MAIHRKLGDLVGKAIGPAVSFGGDLIGSAIGARRARHESRRSRKFQERMSRHAVRYRVEDLKAAGINPILAAQMGLGGGTPSGAMAQMKGPEGLGSKAASTGLQSMLMRAQLENIKESTRKTGAEADVIGPQAELYKEGLIQLQSLIGWVKEVLPQIPGIVIPKSARDVLSKDTRKYLQRAIDEDDVNTALGTKRSRVVEISAGKHHRLRGVSKKKTRWQRRRYYEGK